MPSTVPRLVPGSVRFRVLATVRGRVCLVRMEACRTLDPAAGIWTGLWGPDLLQTVPHIPILLGACLV